MSEMPFSSHHSSRAKRQQLTQSGQYRSVSSSVGPSTSTAPPDPQTQLSIGLRRLLGHQLIRPIGRRLLQDGDLKKNQKIAEIKQILIEMLCEIRFPMRKNRLPWFTLEDEVQKHGYMIVNWPSGVPRENDKGISSLNTAQADTLYFAVKQATDTDRLRFERCVDGPTDQDESVRVVRNAGSSKRRVEIRGCEGQGKRTRFKSMRSNESKDDEIQHMFCLSGTAQFRGVIRHYNDDPVVHIPSALSAVGASERPFPTSQRMHNPCLGRKMFDSSSLPPSLDIDNPQQCQSICPAKKWSFISNLPGLVFCQLIVVVLSEAEGGVAHDNGLAVFGGKTGIADAFRGESEDHVHDE
ncbi:hypothetical protein BU15DRAFT_66386 [Melanogaster broomeanus]|nr:hypothetical protein BU15DRAFT_66386 [Melanogaster broomeanus]